MRLLSLSLFLLSSLLAFVPHVAAIDIIKSDSLETCDENSDFTATLFNVAFTPSNNSLSVNMIGVSSVEGEASATITVLAYGKNLIHKSVNLCDIGIPALCPLPTGSVTITDPFPDLQSITKQIPAVAYTVPDLDLVVRVRLTMNESGKNIACVQTRLLNGKTVYQQGVAWAVAAIAGLGLIVSAINSGLGYSNTAAHIAANALSLFGFFQAQALIGMTAVSMPPIVQSWTQNFQWSMGIIRLGFLQRVATWYQRSTGGSPSRLISSLPTQSVSVAKRKRNLDWVGAQTSSALGHARRGMEYLGKRGDSDSDSSGRTVVRGIERVGFRAGIDPSNVFLTGFMFYIFFVFVVILLVLAAKVILDLAAKRKWIEEKKFQEFRDGWRNVLRGILYRLTLIGYPQMCCLCLWELTHRDSPGELVVAICMFLCMTISLVWASYKVISLALQLQNSPAFALYSDMKYLNKWGFLYVQFRATCYYCIVPLLAYLLIKTVIVGLVQVSGEAQAIGLLILEALLLIGASILRPWMDRKTNAFNISIAAMNFINVILLLFFSNIFNQPAIVTGVMGVLFFVLNAVFAFVLLILVLVSSLYSIFAKDPESRYQPMRDDRTSFMKNKNDSTVTTELDALGTKARDMEINRHSITKDAGIIDSHPAGLVPLPPADRRTSSPDQMDQPYAVSRTPSPQAYYHDHDYNQSMGMGMEQGHNDYAAYSSYQAHTPPPPPSSHSAGWEMNLPQQHYGHR